MMHRSLWTRYLTTFAAIVFLLSAGCASTHQEKVADCTTNPLITSLNCPRGQVHQLLLGVPKSNSKAAFSGRLQVSEQGSGKPLCDITFNSRTAQICNWLDSQNLDGYILTWQNKKGWQNIEPGTSYKVVTEFNQPPPPGSSLWMTWVR